MDQPFRGWIASLSNGETVFQDREYDNTPGDHLSSWRELLQRLAEESLEITQMRLQIGGKTFTSQKHAEGYYQAGMVRHSFPRGEEKHYQGIGQVVGDKIYIVWANEQGDIWQENIPLKEGKLHTTLYY